MSDFDIRAAVRNVINETDLVEPDQIAEKVAEGVPGRLLRSVLAHVLRDFVRIEFGRTRMGQTAPASGQVSAKVRAIRDAAPGWLRERVFTASGWAMLGDCGHADLLFVEQALLVNAQRSTAAAARYARLAALVEQHGVDRISDLPPAVLAGVAWRAAA